MARALGETPMGPLVCLALLPFLWRMGAWAQDCGLRPAYDGPHGFSVGGSRIVGGTRVPEGKWPWVVSIFSGPVHFCGGSIINAWWVLSAAHCFVDESRKRVQVKAGRVLLGWQNVTIWTQKIHMHPGFNRISYDNDIALLLLEKPIPYNWYHSPLCLPDHTIVPNDNMWGTCFVAGWGLTNPVTQEGTIYMLDVELPLVDWATCKRWLNFLSRNMICAGYEEGGRDSCQGDSGGPLMCRPPKNNPQKRWYQVGVVSSGFGCGVRMRPGLYTRVSNYLSWVEQTAAGAGHPFRVPQSPPESHAPIHGAMGHPIHGAMGHPIHGAMGHPVLAAMGQPVLGAMGHPVQGAMGHPIHRPMGHPIHRPMGHPIQGAMGHPIHRPIGHPIQGAIGHPIHRPMGHPTQGAIGHPIHRPIGHPIQGAIGHPIHRPMGHPTQGAMGQAEMAEAEPDMEANMAGGSGAGQGVSLPLLLWALVGGMALAPLWPLQ